MKKVLSIIGTRPEAIKMAPVIKELELNSEYFKSIVCVTGQHREMLDQVLGLFNIKPDYDLNLMRQNQTLANLTSDLISGLDCVVKQSMPDYILAQGDTTTVMAAALVAFYNNIQFGHIEAGLRTQSINSPFPEEANRRITDALTTHYFAPTVHAKTNLLLERAVSSKIYVTGNTVIDALYAVLKKPYEWSASPLKRIPQFKKIILVTAHRRESFGVGLESICKAVGIISETLIDREYHIVFPVHLNPKVQGPVHRILSGKPNVSLLEPLDYRSMANLLKNSFIVLTDSGGLQEEAPGLGVPVLVMRDETERPEGVEIGAVKLIGSNKDKVVNETMELLNDDNAYLEMSKQVCPYGDGASAKRIIEILKVVL